MAEAQRVLEQFTEPMAELFADSRLAALIAGAGEALAGLPEELLPISADASSPPGDGPPPIVAGFAGDWEWPGMRAWLPLIERAVVATQNRRVMTAAQFKAANEETRRNAFSVASLGTREAVEEVREAIVEALDKGLDGRAFVDRIEESFGVSPLSVGRLDNVFRTATAQAYSDGAEAVHDSPIVRDAFPYVENLPIDDTRLTDLCDVVSRSGLDGTAVYRVDDPVWRKFKPPRHWRCRCTANYLTVEQAAERGVKEAIEWARTGRPPAIPQYVRHPATDLPRGWTARMSWRAEKTRRGTIKAVGTGDDAGKKPLYGEDARKVLGAKPIHHRAAESMRTTSKAAGTAIAAAPAEVKARIDSIVERVPESVKAPLANAYHAIHAGMMSVNMAATSTVAEIAKVKGLTDDETKRLSSVLGRIDLAGQVAAYAAAGVAMVTPGMHEMAVLAKLAGGVPVASCAYVLYSAATDRVSTLQAALNVMREKFPEAIKGAAAFAWGAISNPLKLQQHEPAKMSREPWHSRLVDGMARGGDFYEACVCVAIDEGIPPADAVRMADEAAR